MVVTPLRGDATVAVVASRRRDVLGGDGRRFAATRLAGPMFFFLNTNVSNDFYRLSVHYYVVHYYMQYNGLWHWIYCTWNLQPKWMAVCLSWAF